MNKAIFKVLSIIMALCVFLGAMPVVVSAQDVETFCDVDMVEIIEFSPDAEVPFNPVINTNKYFSTGEQVDTSKFFYNQLTAAEKKIYDELWNFHSKSYAGCAVNNNQITLSITMSGTAITGTGTSVSTAENTLGTNTQQLIMRAMTALTEDNPLYFGSSGFGFSFGYSKKLSGSQYTLTLTTLKITLQISTDHYSSVADIMAKRDAAVAKMETIKINGISRHEKLKSIHDYLSNNIVYDEEIASPNIFDVYGAFVNGFCVCEGYGEAFKMLCDREGIPCITVIGTGNGGPHKWNMVQMEDGEWYTIDTTWNDQKSYILYDYFLSGSATRTPHFFSSYADSQIHIGDCRLFTSMTTALSYPTLSTDTYGVGMLQKNAGDVHFDKTRGVIMVGKEVSGYQDCFATSTTARLSRTLNGSGTTTSTITLKDGTTTITYLVAMRGDIDASNITNSTDYSVITNVCATTRVIESGTAKFYAGDMNQDGAIDGFDAIAHELYTNGILTFN